MAIKSGGISADGEKMRADLRDAASHGGEYSVSHHRNSWRHLRDTTPHVRKARGQGMLVLDWGVKEKEQCLDVSQTGDSASTWVTVSVFLTPVGPLDWQDQHLPTY